MGKNGSKVYYKGKTVFGRPFLRKDTIETTGAGDTFMACVLNTVLEKGLEQLTQESLTEMLLFANAASSISFYSKHAFKMKTLFYQLYTIAKKHYNVI